MKHLLPVVYLLFVFLITCSTSVKAQCLENGEYQRVAITFQDGHTEMGRLRIAGPGAALRYRSGTGTARDLRTERIRKVRVMDTECLYRPVYFRAFSQETASLRLARQLLQGDIALYRVNLNEEEYPADASGSRPWLYILHRAIDTAQIDQFDARRMRGNYRVTDRYQGALKYLIYDCDDLHEQARRTPFTDAGMMKLFRAFGYCQNTEVRTTGIDAGRERLRTNSAVDVEGFTFTGEGLEGALGFSIGYELNLNKPDLSKYLGLSVGTALYYHQYTNDEVSRFVVLERRLTALGVQGILGVDLYLINQRQQRLIVQTGIRYHQILSRVFDEDIMAPDFYITLDAGLLYQLGKLRLTASYSLLPDSQQVGVSDADGFIRLGIGYVIRSF